MKPKLTFLLLVVALLAAAPVSAQMVTSTRPAIAQLDKEPKKTLKKGREREAKKDAAADAKSAKKKLKKAKISPERMTQVMVFVDEHHPELGEMLELVKKNQPATFQRAINGVNASLGKLESLKTRKPERYPIALERWKLTSRVSVASAKLKHKDSEANRKELELLLSEQVDFQVKTLKAEREQLQQRMSRLDKQIADSEAGKSEHIKRRIETVVSGGNRKKKKD